MSRLNLGFFYGRVHKAPRISYDEETGEYYDNGAMIDSKNLYEWAFDKLEMKTIIDKNELVKEIGLEFAWNRDSIQLSPKDNYSTILPSDVKLSSIDRKYDVPKSVKARSH